MRNMNTYTKLETTQARVPVYSSTLKVANGKA